MKLKILTIASAFLVTTGVVFAQQDTTNVYEMSLEELMNIKIVSASKKTESLFDALLSSSVVTREEIKNAGSTSIMEALRLVPGVIVREQTNGNYDIHVRGLDNVPPNTLVLASTNTTTLVMINNRPVYNYLQGGTFWESLPIDLNDVDRIEVIRGPSSTLYGPNAVSGVINIITRTVEKDGLNVNGSAQYGSQKTAIANTSLGYKFNEKFDVSISGNYQTRGRDVRYFDNATNRWVTSQNDLSIGNANERYPNPDKSMLKYGVNTFLRYKANEKVQAHLIAGLQDSEVQAMIFDNPATNISTTTTNSKYVDFQSSIYGLSTQVSYTTAVQSPSLGMSGSKYDYNVTDISAEYDLNINGLLIKPGITYRRAVYNDDAYWDIENGEGLIGGRQIMETLGGGIRLEYKLLEEKLRLTGGIRLDKFTYPKDKLFTSYQMATSYKFNDKNLIRLVFSKAYRSPFIFDTYLNARVQVPTGADTFQEFVVLGNKDAALVNSTMLELGYRTVLRKNISLDVETYYTQTENYTATVSQATEQTPQNYPVVASTSAKTTNIPLQVQQMGTSISLTIVADKFQIKPFVTFQKTTLIDYSPYFSTSTSAPSPSNNFDPAANNIDSGIGTERDHKFTPKAYGGAHINYNISSKFNFNVSGYWFSKQTFYHLDNTTYQDGVRGVEHIKGKLIINSRLSYAPVKGLSVFVTGKNLLARKSVEYYQGDAIPAMILGGVSFDL